MKLFVWLWNPWSKYETTRHNVGFLVLEMFCNQHGFTEFLYQQKFDAELATGTVGKYQIIAMKPQTYMNKSGKAVQEVMAFYKILPQDVLVFHDDIDLAFGAIKLKYNSGHGGHNGIRDTYEKLGTPNIWKLKLWVGRPPHPEYSVSDYVLWSFSGTELERRKKHEKEVLLRVEEYIRNTWGSH